MKLIKVEKTCAICKNKDEYNEIISRSEFGQPDFDLKPSKNMHNHGIELQQCQHCGYVNYDIEQPIEDRFNTKDALELWKKEDKYQEVINSDNNTSFKKFMLMALQSEANCNFEEAYRWYLNASWVCNDEEKTKALKYQALYIFDTEILPNITGQLLQVCDTARQVKEFEVCKDILNALKYLTDDEQKRFNKILEYETMFVENKDTNSHNIEEIKD